MDWLLSSSNADTAILLSEQALGLSNKIKWKKGEVQSLTKLGVYYGLYKIDYPKALEYYFKALKIAEQIALPEMQANTLGNIANLYSAKGEYDKALEYFNRTLKISKSIHYKKGISISLNNMASLYNSTNDYNNAIEYALQAQTMAQELNDKKSPKSLFLTIH